jgi:hypothetical protein
MLRPPQSLQRLPILQNPPPHTPELPKIEFKFKGSGAGGRGVVCSGCGERFTCVRWRQVSFGFPLPTNLAVALLPAQASLCVPCFVSVSAGRGSRSATLRRLEASPRDADMTWSDRRQTRIREVAAWALPAIQTFQLNTARTDADAIGQQVRDARTSPVQLWQLSACPHSGGCEFRCAMCGL